jgi:hypothetical protein
MMCTYVWSKAPIGCKKYPAVAGYLMKMEQSSTKRTLKDPLKEGLIKVVLVGLIMMVLN